MSAVEGDYPKVPIGTLAHQDFAWEIIERSRGKFNFQSFDNYMAAVQQHGLVGPATNTANMAMTLAAGTPGWAVADQSSCKTGASGLAVCTAAPDNIQDWKDFLTAVLQHYNGNTQPHIKYYELWNEFNITLWWTGTDAQLVALAQAAYPIIHQDPYSILLTPSVAGPAGTVTPNSAVTRMTRYLQAGGFQYADGGAFHGYIGAQSGVNPFPMPEDDSTSGCKPFVGCYGSIITRATQMRAVFDQNGLAGKPMFQTEGSWGNQTITDLDTQIAWLARWNLLQAGLRSTLNLQMAAWFTWGGGTTFGWGDIEDATLQPTAAGLAYGHVYNWAVGATISQPCSGAANGTWTCTLARPGGYIAQAVWNTKGLASYTPGPGYTQYRDLAGNTTPISAGASVSIGAKPILVESGAASGSGTVTSVSSADGVITTLAAEAIASGYGINLATSAEQATTLPLPTNIGGTSVTVRDASGISRPAGLFYVSPTQVNYQVPSGEATGAASVTVSVNGDPVATGTAQIAAVAPAIYSATGTGTGPAAAILAIAHADGSSATTSAVQCSSSGCTAALIDLGSDSDVAAIELFGTGIRGRSAQAAVTCKIGSAILPVFYADAAPGFAGLDQVNVLLPKSLRGSGNVNVTLTVDGQTSNTVVLNFK